MRVVVTLGLALGGVCLLSLWLLGRAPRERVSSDDTVPHTGTSLRVATFNMHFGVDERGRYNLQRTVDALVALEADVIGLQEVLRAHPRYRCDDQPTQLAEGLRRATGVRWWAEYAPAAIADGGDEECIRLGRATLPPTEGVLLLTRRPLQSASVTSLPGSRAVLRARLRDRPSLAIEVTHLTAYSRNAGLRAVQAGQLARWGAAEGGARVLLGDLNGEADAAELSALWPVYQDAWGSALRGVTVERVSDAASTRPGRRSRIDYVLFAGPLHVRDVRVVRTTTRQHPWEASDHRPVVATVDVSVEARP